MNPSAPSTPHQQRRSANLRDRTGALSAAGAARPNNEEASAVRPITHDGRLQPASPDRKTKRSFAALSPRQISFKLLPNQDGSSLPSSRIVSPSTIRKVSPDSSAKKAHVMFDAALVDEMESMSKIEEEFGNAKTVTEGTTSKWPKVAFDGTFAKFIKKPEADPSPAAKKTKLDPKISAGVGTMGIAAVSPSTGTAYPSLSYRLNASMQMNAPPTSLYKATPKVPAATVRRKNANMEILSRSQLPVTLAAPTRLEAYRGAVLEQDADQRIHSVDQPEQLSHSHPADTSAVAYDTMEAEELSAASLVFRDLEMDDVLDYLLASRDRESKHAPFVHVTPRYNIDHNVRGNFYDLVALEKPGNPQSDLVWIPSHRRDKAAEARTLDPLQVMQLSLHGLLVRNEGECSGELMSLRDFMLQRSQVEFLRTGRFFGCFFELKAFSAWRRYTRGRAVNKMKRKLLKETFLSDVELVSCVHETNCVVHELNTHISLFAFHGRGAICVTDYVALQLKRTAQIKDHIVGMVNTLTASMQAQYEAYCSGQKLASMEQDVKDHHPFKDLLNSADAPLELYKLRSLMRLKEEFREKLKRLFLAAQFKIETAMVMLMERYWLRFKQFLLGVRGLVRSKARQEDNYWEIDRSLFDAAGNVLPEVLEEFNTVGLCAALDAAEGRTPAASASTEHVSSTATAAGIAAQEAAGEDPTRTGKVLTDNFHYAGGTRNNEDRGVRVKQEWEELGSHLCVDINLCINDRPMQLADFMSLATIDRLKVVIFPGKTLLMDQMHSLCGALGDLISALPNLKRHPLIFDPKLLNPQEVVDPELEMGDLLHPRSIGYFTHLAVHPIYSCTGGHERTVDALRLMQQAYGETASVEAYLFKLFEIVRKLWSLTPSQLAKQTERSMVLAKVKDFIENPDTVEDLRRSQVRDLGRMKAFRTAAEFLTRVVETINGFQNIKHRTGIVSSFRPILHQIRSYRSIQSYLLYTRLPVSFNTRCSVFYDFIRKFDESIEAQTSGFDVLISLMHRLKNFETVKEIFDGEYEICEGMFRTVETFASVPSTPLDSQIRQLFDARMRHGGAPALSSDKLFHLFEDAKDRLNLCINKAKSLILGELNTIKNDTMARRQGLHSQIAAEYEKLQHFELVAPNVSPADVSKFLQRSGNAVFEMRWAVDETVDAQMILTEVHDIIGAANAVLKAVEVDKFTDMDQLEAIYQVRCKAWTCISDTGSIKRQLLASKLVNSKIASWSAQFSNVRKTYEYLFAYIDEKEIIDQIQVQMRDLNPKMELSSYLAAATLRPRHWKWMGEKVFAKCGMTLKFSGRNSEFVSVVDNTGKESVGLGNINRLDISELVNRNLESQLDKIRSVTGEAVIESCMESTLDAVENSMKTFCVQVSGEWLRDSRLREKIFLELNEVVNITQLSVMVKYCMKSVLIVENTSQDMSLTTFDARIDKLKLQVQKLEKFVINLGEAQRQWFYLLHFVKFSNRGEIDRDSARLFNTCTEDLKKIEMVLQQRSENLLQAFANSNETDLNTDGLKSNLAVILDDAHGSVQSMLDACPRLSLLSYNRIVVLVKTWMLGPQLAIDFISHCFHALFEGVGTLNTAMHVVQRLYMCTGFTSYDHVETFIFAEQIPFNLPLDEFIRRFNREMRGAIAISCDSLMLHRINCLQALLTDTPAPVVLAHIANVFQQRTSQLYSMFSDQLPNIAYLLISSVSFAEDMWTSLGHPTGGMIISRDDLSIEQAAFAKAWKVSLAALLNDCNENIANMQEMMLTNKRFSRMKSEKAKALLSSLLLLEISFLRVVEELLSCKSLESATELWAGRYQLRFQYNKAERYQQSPIEISLGSINIPYGLEYGGGHIRVVPDIELESALQKVLSSAFSLRGSVFISYDNQQSLFEAPGEYSVSCADIAAALGRIGTTITAVTDKQAVHFYLARLVYLDAVGSVDFTNIDHVGLQVLINALNSFWNAIESKTDQFIQDALKFPLKNKFSRNDLQGERRKQNLAELRTNINTLKAGSRYVGPIVIGMASETFYSNVSVFDHFYRSIFNAISIPNNQPINNLGLMLTAEGFLFGMDLQSTLKASIQHLGEGKYEGGNNRTQQLIVQRLCTSFEIRSLVSTTAKTLRLYHLSKITIAPGKVSRFKIELQCFCTVLWERVLMFAYEMDIDLVGLRNELFIAFYKKLEMISSPEDIIAFDGEIGTNELAISDALNMALIRASHASGLVCNHEFIAKCALLWGLVAKPTNSVVILTGEAAVGKTAMRNTVISTIRSVGTEFDAFFSESWPVKCRRSAYVILVRMKQHHARLVEERAEQRRRERAELLRASNQPDDIGDFEAESGKLPGALEKTGSVKFKLPAEAPAPAPQHRTSVIALVPLVLTPMTENGVGGSQARDTPAANVPASQRKEPRVTVIASTERQPVNVSVVYHASLSAAHLLGQYDASGRWMDGILVRKIRGIDEKKKKQTKASATIPDTLHVIVLNGPIGYYVEQIFSGPIYFTSSTAAPSGLSSRQKLLFPSAELHNLGADVKIIIETNDITNASPSFFVTVPMLKATASNEICIQRLLTLWVRSMIHWLGDFPPWLDVLDFLGELFLKKEFITELLCADYVGLTMPAVVIVSRMSAFLRLLEDLLSQVHQMALVDATFIIPDDKEDTDSSESDDDDMDDEDDDDGVTQADVRAALSSRISLPVAFTTSKVYLKGAMTLSGKHRELLTMRAKLSIIYAAVWGFGGTINSTERRKNFDACLRDTVEKHFGIENDLNIAVECSIFDCVLDLEAGTISQAVQLDPRTLAKLSNPGVPKKFEPLNIYASLVAGTSADKTAFGTQDRLIFRTPSNRAVDAAVRRLLGTGANVMVFGAKGAGKSMLLADILTDLKAHLPTAQRMRGQVNDNLVDIVNGTRKAEGIFAALEILKYIMSKFATMELKDDTKAEFHQLWNTAGEGLKMLWSENAKKNCADKTVSSAVTSLRGAAGASDLRAWLEREFTTETRTVLETPRFSYGIAFVDDLHICAQQYDKQDMRLLEDRSEALLKGLMDGTPLFNVKRNVFVRSTVYLGLHSGSYDAAYATNPRQMPVLHQEAATDLRMQDVHLSDDFVLQRMGVVSAATGQFSDLVNSSCFTQVLPHFCALGLPAMNATELHTALIAGATVCMSAGTADASIVDVLKNEITELSRFTMNMCSRLISTNDGPLTCQIERAIRSLVIIDISLVSRFCSSLRFGCSNVSNPGGLLQLYTHEWKRYFLDPLPDGAQRDRIVFLLKEQLDTLDDKKWSISTDWLKALEEDFAAHKDRVWTDSRVFEALERTVSDEAKSSVDAAPSLSAPSEDTVQTAATKPHAPHAPGTKPSLHINIASSSMVSPLNSPLLTGTAATPGTTAGPATSTATATGHHGVHFFSSSKATPPGTVAPTPVAAASANTTEASPAPLHRLYLPVELDRAGTERSLYSGAWDHAVREYRPIQTAEAIAQGEISKVLDFTTLVGAGDVRKVLYPAAISLVLRMVRILSVAGKHVLLAGYYGTTRLTALHLAAKICNLEPISFDVKNSAAIVEAQPSDGALYSSDFVRFLKGVVYKAAGLRIRTSDSAGGDDQPSLLGTDSSRPVGYELVPSQRLLVAIQSCQQLPDKDRITLLNLIDYDDPGYLFSDNEILGMTEALRAQLKDQLMEQQLCSDHFEAEDARKLKNIHLTMMGLNIDTAPEVSPTAKLPSTPPHTSRKNSAAATGANRSRTASTDVAAGNADGDTNSAADEAAAAVAHKLKPVFTGYAFHYVKEYLKNAVRTHMSLVIDVDLPRPMKLDAAGSRLNAEAVLKKMTNVGQAPGQGQRPAKQPRKGSTSGEPEKIVGRAHQVSIRQRYSLLASRKNSVMTGGVVSSVAADTEAERLMYSPNQVNVAQAARPHEQDEYAAQRPKTEDLSSLTIAGKPEAHGIFTCSILGPMLSRRFYMLWYDIDGVDASRGICTMLMKNERRNVRTFQPGGLIPNLRSLLDTGSPLTLSLRTSTIGIYYQPTGVYPAGAPDSVGAPTPRNRIAAARADKEKIEKEERRRNKFKSTSVLSRYNLVLKTDNNYNALALDQLGLLSHVGVFKSFATVAKLEDKYEEKIDFSVASFIDEARAILPHVLSANIAADALFLTEPVICPGPEVTAELSATVVMNLLQVGSRNIIRRKFILETVLDTYKDAFVALEATDASDKLVRHNEELIAVMRKDAKEIDACRKEIEAIQRTSERTENFELECMLQEDMLSRQKEIAVLEERMEELLLPVRKRIFSYGAIEWQAFAVPFSSRPSKPFLELMRAIMIAIRFTPPKGKGDKSNAGGKMDDDTVARCATQLLVKFQDFASQLCSLAPASLPKTHLQALRMLNLLLNSAIAANLNVEQQTPHARMQFMAERCAADTNPPNNVVETLKKYLLLVDVAASIYDYTSGVKSGVIVVNNQVTAVVAENQEAKRLLGAVLKLRYDTSMAHMHNTDATVAKNRQQLEVIERNNAQKGDIARALQQASNFATAELKQIKDVLRYLVSDCCVAVAVTLRAGWLPEQVRQECMEQLRQNLIRHEVRVSDSPFILGHLCDRLQMRQWTELSDSSLPRDPASINAMSLVHLVPYYTLIVDPDGTAPTILLADPLEGYDKYTITAQKFSLSTFQSWIQNLAGRSDAALSVIITDLQAGVSDDLICFLSCDYLDESTIPQGDTSAACGQLPRGRLSDAVLMDGISLVLNPSLDYLGECRANDQSGGDNNDGAKFTARRIIHIPCRLRLYLVTAKAPAMDSFGVSRPLPTSCMKHVTTVHWAVSSLPSHNVEAKPANAAGDKHYVSDQTLSYRMGAAVCKKISPLHFQYHTMVNSLLVSDTLNLYNVEEGIVNQVYTWSRRDTAENSSHAAGDDQLVATSVLNDDATLSFILESVQARRNYTIDIEMSKTLQRELVTYLATVTEVCSMAVDFVRMCAAFLPSEIFTPYSLSSQAICSLFMQNVLDIADEKHFLNGMPTSLAEMTRISRAVVKVQRKVRAGRLQTDTIGFSSKSNRSRLSSSSGSLKGSTKSIRMRGRRRATVQQMNTQDLSQKRFGLMQHSREQAASDLSCLLLPLRTFILREMVNYVQLSIRPGLEWLGKFMFVLTTWSQSDNNIPTEEVRTLMHFVMQSAQQASPRYSHFISFNGVEKGDLSKDLQSLARYTRESTLGMRRSRSGGSTPHARGLSGCGSGSGISTGASPRTSTGKTIGDEDGYDEQGYLKRNRSRSRSEDVTSEEAAEEAEGYDEFVADLPTAGKMANRVTAFRVNEQPKARSSVRFSAGTDISPSSTPSNKRAADDSNVVAGGLGLQWMEKGSGLVDGLWLNKRSTRWRLNPLDQQYYQAHNTSSKMLRGRYVMLDVKNTSFTLKHSLFRPTARQGDPFEAEWLKVKGVRLFATTSATAAAALGASILTIEEMQVDRKTALMPGYRKSTAGTAADGNVVDVGGGGNNSAVAGRRDQTIRKASATPANMSPPAKRRESKARKASRKSISKPNVGGADAGGAAEESKSRGGSSKASFTSKHRRLSLTAENLPTLHDLSDALEGVEGDSSATATPAGPPAPASAIATINMNVAARTLHSGRVSIALANMSAGMGEHRSSLMFGEPTSAGADIVQPTSGTASNRNSISQLCLRRASVIENKQRASQIGSPGREEQTSSKAGGVQNETPEVDPFENLRRRYNAQGEAIEELSDLLTSPQAFQNMLMLESHTNLAPIFKGMAVGIVRNIHDFSDWKSALFALTAVDPTKLSDKDLEVLLFTIKPPVFDDFEDENTDRNGPGSPAARAVDEGLWLKGYELTLMQSLLLSEAIVPGSCGSLVEVMFALIATYLRKDGHIAHHPDETHGAEMSDSDDDYDFDEEENDEEEDAFDINSTVMSRHASNVRSSIFSVASRNNSASSAHHEVTRSTFFRGLENFRKMSRVSFQEGVALINCWDKLEKVLNGTCKERGPQYVRPPGISESTLCCRDFENWEAVLLEVLTEDVGMEKFVFMKDLRDSTLGNKSSVFLASHLHSGQMAVFTQRARDLAVHNYDQIHVVNCASPAEEGLNPKAQRVQLAEAIRTIKSAVASQRTKKAIVEMLDLQSPYGNSLISSVLLHAGHAQGGAVQKGQDATQHQDLSSLNTHIGKKDAGPADTTDKSQAVASYKRQDQKPWQTSFPLIISTQWGGITAGRGPFMTIADLSYTWLPRFFSPDVINAEADARETLYTKFAGLPPSLSESCGILCEELETSLLWVMNSNKSLAKSHLTPEIRQRLRKATRIEIRVTAALVTIWQLVQYVRCARREEHDMPAVWSACLNPVSLWQLTRLMLKTADVLHTSWPGGHVSTIVEQEKFTKAMWLMAESFSNTECDIYNYTKLFGTAFSGEKADAGHTGPRRTQSASMIAKSIPLNNSRGPIGGIKTAGASTPRSGVPSRATYIQQLKRSSRAGVGAVTGLAAPRHTMRRAAANMTPLLLNAVTTTTTRAIADTEDPNMSSRAKKLMKRALKHVEEARALYVQTLCSFDKFSLTYARAEAAPSSNTPAASAAKAHGHLHPAEPETSSEAVKSALLEKEFMTRFLSLMGVYFAQVLLEYRYLSGGAPPDEDLATHLTSLAGRTIDARRQSNKINIRSFLDKDGNMIPSVDGGAESWPPISEEIDVTFGSLSSADVIRCLVKWTFNGGEAVANKNWGKMNKQKIMNSVKKLSLKIKAGQITL